MVTLSIAAQALLGALRIVRLVTMADDKFRQLETVDVAHPTPRISDCCDSPIQKVTLSLNSNAAESAAGECQGVAELPASVQKTSALAWPCPIEYSDLR